MPSPFDHLAIPSAPYRKQFSVRLTATEGPPEQQLEEILQKEKTQPFRAVEVPEAGHEVAAEAKRQLLERIRAARPAQRGSKVGEIITEGKLKARVLEVNATGRPTRLETIDDVPVPKPPAPQKLVEEQQVRIRSARPLDLDDAARELPPVSMGKVPPVKSGPVEQAPAPEPRKPAPAESVRSQGERITFRSLLRDHVERVTQKVPGRAWLEILGPRMQAFYHRQFASMKAMQQEKAQGKLDLAKEKTAYYADAIERSGGALKFVFGNRLRKWQKREELLKAKVNTLDIYRTRRMERHNTFQQRVVERYERDMVPYQERIADLKKKREAILGAKKKLEQERVDAVKLVTAAKARPPGFFDMKGKANLARLERAAASIDRDIAKANKGIDAISAPLAKAEAKFQKFDSRRRIAVAMMELPEQKDLVAQPL